jgi:hypothetical protein
MHVICRNRREKRPLKNEADSEDLIETLNMKMKSRRATSILAESRFVTNCFKGGLKIGIRHKPAIVDRRY